MSNENVPFDPTTPRPYKALKNHIEALMQAEVARTQDRLGKFKDALAVLRKAKAPQEVTEVLMEKVRKVRERQKMTLNFARTDVDTYTERLSLNFMEHVLNPSAQKLKEVLKKAPSNRIFTEEVFSLLKKAHAVTVKYEKALHTPNSSSHYASPKNKPRRVTEESLEAYMRKSHRTVTLFSKMTQELASLFDEVSDNLTRPPPLLHYATEGLQDTYKKASKSCVLTGVGQFKRALDSLADGEDIESFSTYLGDGLSHWTLAQAFLSGNHATIAKAATMATACRDKLSLLAWDAVLEAEKEPSRARARTPKP